VHGGRVPVARTLLQHDAILLHTLDELEGAGTHGLEAELVAGLLRHLRAQDHAGAVGELRDQRRERSLEDEANGRGVGSFDPVDRRQLGLPERALHGHVPLEAGLDGSRVHGLAVVELDARTELDGDDFSVLGDLVRQRQLRHDVELLVDVEQLVAQRGEDDAADVGARERRVEHVGVLGEADAQGGLGRGGRGGEKERDGKAGQMKPFHEGALPSMLAAKSLSILRLALERPE
jgi:hypothetical protein